MHRMRNLGRRRGVALMMRKTIIVAAIAIAATSLVMRSLCSCGKSPAATPQRQAVIEPAAAVATSVDIAAPPPARSFEAKRNLFAFVAESSREQAAPVRRSETRIADAPLVQRSEPAAAVAERPIAIPYRFIGSFGPAGNLIAVFARDGELINARIGEAFGGNFVVRGIGIESVTIAVVAGDRAAELIRLPIAGR